MFETHCRMSWYREMARNADSQIVSIVIASLIFSVVLTPITLIIFFLSGAEPGASFITGLI